ncbi:MAG: chromosome partition protein Smc [Pseudomonadota bacterium]
MRLNKLKLAGFKSFVDPTQVELPGQLIGVVGPNGCGKSNIIDAVRWVLGESRATELRGESMQDVIFNGTTSRKPVSRASVEMVFDNSLGRAVGQWSQYAELSVKRVLTRNGQSDYFINNLKVRRKDVTDLFMGTGLGPRAYAIIGQGTVSRIIEAKPEELRVFLEEAAGVTRYKERRKETEGRLADTRENLARLEDIRQELGTQISRLESQAEVAERYQSLQAELMGTQQQLWSVRLLEGRTDAVTLSAGLSAAQIELEETVARQRNIEAELETLREAYYTANDAVQTAQSAFFSINAEVATIEADIRHRQETRRNLESRLTQLAAEKQSWQTRQAQAEEDLVRWTELQEHAALRLAQAQERLAGAQEGLPAFEDAEREAQAQASQFRGELSGLEQRLQVAQANRANAERHLARIDQQIERLSRDEAALTPPDTEQLQVLAEAREAAGMALAELQEQQTVAEQAVHDAEQALQAASDHQRELQAELTRVQARHQALKQLQERVQATGSLPDWLKKAGLQDRPALWQQIRVAQGWELAVEAVLRDRLKAVACGQQNLPDLDRWFAEPPGLRVTLLLSGAEGNAVVVTSDALLHKIDCLEDGLKPILAQWLASIRVAPTLAAARALQSTLAAGETVVTQEGHLLDRYSVTFFAPDAADHGLLERQQELESTEARVTELSAPAESATHEVEAARERLRLARQTLEALRQQSQTAQSELSSRTMEHERLVQTIRHYEERHKTLKAAQEELSNERAGEVARLDEMSALLQNLEGSVAVAQTSLTERLSVRETASRALRDARDALVKVEREVQEAEFSCRECQTRLDDLHTQSRLSVDECRRIDDGMTQARAELEGADGDELREKLEAALMLRGEREQALAAIRDTAESHAGALRAQEENRLRMEQQLEPVRARINDHQLKLQAAELAAAQFEGLLTEAGCTAEQIESLLQNVGDLKPAPLQSAITRLQREIEAMGPVNLAALVELNSAQERKTFLDAQSDDLVRAMETLENAIRRIDKETRALLQETFDLVNQHFGSLFPTLFGGGEARLIMTGDEILDAGVQVMAQPPGKKNSTIHLLSGGEKTLTAIALVFSLFQLNPAPFCLLDEVDAPLDDANTVRFCDMVKRMSDKTQFLFISHNKIAMEMGNQLVGVTMQEFGVSRIVEVDMEEALQMREKTVASS